MTRLLRPSLIVCAVLACAAPAIAHETRPGFLELREQGNGLYDFLWKKPSGGEIEIFIAPVIPTGCRLSTDNQQQLTPGALVVRGLLRCDGGIAGKTLAIDGLDSTITDVIVRVHHQDGRLESHLLKPTSPTVVLGAASSTWQRSRTYVRLGIEHILLGVDHLLFVLGLLLIVADRWMLLRTITAFTVAHSLTLAIATLGYASAPLPPLNAAIALSILFLGPEIVRRWRGESSLTIRHPWVVAFAFGLLHGFGFASGLTTMGLPTGEIPMALLLFNVGVEVGQLFFVALILAAGTRVPRARDTVAARRAGASRLRGGIARRLLDHPAHARPHRRAAMSRRAAGRDASLHGAPKPSGEGGRRPSCAADRSASGPYHAAAASLALIVSLASATPAFAHVQQGAAQGLLTGLSHPVSGPDHVLAMIAVGLWGAQLGPPAVWVLPVTFPMVMAMGAFLGLVGIPLPGIEIGIALSAVLLGLMVAREARPPLVAAAVLVGVFAIFHGHAHGTELPPGQSGLMYSIGFVVATGLLHGVGIAIGLVHAWPWGRRVIRVAGAGVMTAGLFFLAKALA